MQQQYQWLKPPLRVDESLRATVSRDYRQLPRQGSAEPLHEWISDRYRIDLSSHYGCHAISNPWGKASGQLSMTRRQVAEDVAAGLGFVVLKTLIAESAEGVRSMDAWAIKESRMLTEMITSQAGREGWTVSWKGRGWWGSFAEYLQLVREAREAARDSGTLIVPSCKYHLPEPDEVEWRWEEYLYTTDRLLAAWAESSDDNSEPMPLEKDFSPTLAGSDLSRMQVTILEWMRRVPELIKAAATRGNVSLGMKVFNALFDDDFQLQLLRTLHEGTPVDFVVYGNRLFDPCREFDGQRGIAYGGPDLSDRNLKVLGGFHDEMGHSMLPLSATGNITSGRLALEYALRGASSFQLHTFFQLPSEEYVMQQGTKTRKALHELYLHPEEGLVVWLHHLADRRGLGREPLRFSDVVGLGPE